MGLPCMPESATGIMYPNHNHERMTMKCEHCSAPAMRGWILCRRCWKIFADDRHPRPHDRHTTNQGADTMKFTLTSDEISITLEIDTSKLTPKCAAEINNFWSGSRDVLAASSGCVYQAVARRAAGRLIDYLMDGYNVLDAVETLCRQEGWPRMEDAGMSILDYVIPDLNPFSFDVDVA